MKYKRPIAIDLFCGAGGMSLGFEQAGFDIKLGVDRDAYHCAAHDRNFPYGKTLCASVTDLTGEDIKRAANIDGEVDVIFGGPPCQGFSMMGKRDLGDPRSSLVGEFVRIVQEVRPRAFVMENVPGMQLGKTKSFFDFVIKSLSEAGYKITSPAKTLIASDFGAPQKRERLFVLGVRSDVGEAAVYPTKPLAGQAFAKNIGEAFSGLPNIDAHQELFDKDDLEYIPEEREFPRYSAILAGLESDPTDLSRPRVTKGNIVFGNKRTKHAASSIDLYAATQPGEMVPGHKLPRLSFDSVSPTLRAGSESERGSHTAPRPIHPIHARCISVREAARLHGYPDWFAFYPVIHHGFRQVGNSVSPFVARAVGYQIANALNIDLKSLDRGGVIALENSFHLVEDRRKHEKRISHVNEFPKVVNYLFEERFDPVNGGFLNPEFTHDDIDSAIKQSGANMPRIRANSFISEFSRTRNAREILALPLKHGYSLISTEKGGRFVRQETVGAIGRESYSSFSSADMKDCLRASKSEYKSTEYDEGFGILSDADFNRIVGKVVLQSDLFGVQTSKKQLALLTKSGVQEKVLLWRTKSKILQHEAIAKLMQKHEVKKAIVVMGLTNHHDGVVVFDGGCGIKQIYKNVVLWE